MEAKDDSRSDLSSSKKRPTNSFENVVFLVGVDKVQKQKIFEELRDFYNFGEGRLKKDEHLLAEIKTRYSSPINPTIAWKQLGDAYRKWSKEPGN